MRRTDIDANLVRQSREAFGDHYDRVLQRKGRGAFVSRNEARGAIDEEVVELKAALHRGTDSAVDSELLDLAVVCVFAWACLRAKAMEW